MALDAERIDKTARKLRKCLKKSPKRPTPEPTTAHEGVATVIELTVSLKTPPNLNEKNLHPYRLKVKELRDVLRLAHKPTNQKFIDALGQVKDAIGDWHDWEELLEIAAETARWSEAASTRPGRHCRYGLVDSSPNGFRLERLQP